tara:strand:- start:20574 stop:21188 length:615 start_codon:yes stop_codon:yes gene_type:complete
MSVLLQKVEDFVTKQYSRSVWNDFDYHNLEHTLNVVKEARDLAIRSNLPNNIVETIEIAAWFHDLGYEYGVEGHELKSFELAKKFLSKEGATLLLIEEVGNLIQATSIGFERFQSLSQKIMRDADLSNAGLKGFKKCSNALRREWATKMNQEYDDIGWANLQIHYLSNLSYLSESANDKYSKRKRKNLKKYKKRLLKKQRELVH